MEIIQGMSQKYRLSFKVRHLEVFWNTEKYFKTFNICCYNHSCMLERVHGNIVKRANACLDANGQNFEHLFFKNLLLLKCLIVVLPLKLIKIITYVFNNTMILRISK
jgi:hypothetical protein